MKKIKHYNIMLVEDEALLRQSLARHIEALNIGYKVVCQMPDGQSALDALQTRDIHMIITDIRMPVMDGLTLARRVHEQFPHIITLVLTGYADFKYAQEAIRQGVFDYHMREHYMDEIDFSELSAKMGFSSAYLTKLFNKYKGDTPLKHLTEIRIHEAKHLLLNTNLPIREIGEKVGYPDQFHFSKTFRRLTGQNPTAYRKQNR